MVVLEEDKMGRGGLKLLLALLGALLLTVGARGQSVMHKAVGSEVALVPQFSGSPTEITWKFGANKVVEFELNQPEAHFYSPEARKTMEKNGTLTIRNLIEGDAGLYKAEVVVNSRIQETIISLIILDRLATPTITNRTVAEHTIELHCQSSSADVTYAWVKEGLVLTNQQLYNATQTNQNFTLTCVVSNKASNSSAEVIIPSIRDSGLSIGSVVLIIFAVFLIIIIIIITVLKFCPSCCAPVLQCLQWCVSDKQRRLVPEMKNNEGRPSDVNGEMKNNEGRPSDVNAAKKDDEEAALLNPEIKKEEERPSDVNAESELEGSVSLKLDSVGVIQSVDVCRDGVLLVSLKVGVAENAGTLESLRLILDNVEKADSIVAHIQEQDGYTHVKNVEGQDRMTGHCDLQQERLDFASVTRNGEGIMLDLPRAADVKTITLTGQDTLYSLSVSGPKLTINDLTLQVVGGSLTINLKPQDSGKYKVYLHSTENRIASHTFNLEGNHQTKKPQDVVNDLLKFMLKFSAPEEGRQQSDIGSVAFHPINLPDVASFTWRKGGRPVDTSNSRIKIGHRGNLTINNVTSDDKGAYTVYSEDQEMGQEFRLQL